MQQISKPTPCGVSIGYLPLLHFESFLSFQLRDVKANAFFNTSLVIMQSASISRDYLRSLWLTCKTLCLSPNLTHSE